MSKKNQSAKGDRTVRVIMTTVFLFLTLICGSLGFATVVITGASTAHSEKEVQKSGTATATRCWSDGPLFLNFWERCHLAVTWQNGTTSVESSSYGDFSSDDIGQQHNVNFVEKSMSQQSGGYESVVKDISRPWAWLGWILPLPFFGLGMAFAILATIAIKPPKPDKKKRKKKQQNKATAKQN